MSDEIITYLSMHTPAALAWPARTPAFSLTRQQPIDPGQLAALYHRVGANYHWTDRASWTHADWRARSRAPGVSLWLARAADLIGFVELAVDTAGDVEIAYFGLLPAFIGRGFGGGVLAAGVEQAWQWPGARRVWVHTCNFDHPHALANYRARGFSVDRIERVSHTP